jgi:hypothetical protein
MARVGPPPPGLPDRDFRVAAEHGRLPREHAEAYLAELESTARYRPDLWTDLREPAWTYWPSS